MEKVIVKFFKETNHLNLNVFYIKWTTILKFPLRYSLKATHIFNIFKWLTIYWPRFISIIKYERKWTSWAANSNELTLLLLILCCKNFVFAFCLLVDHWSPFLHLQFHAAMKSRAETFCPLYNTKSNICGVFIRFLLTFHAKLNR